MSTSTASVVKHFPSAQNGFQTTLASTIASGAVTVPLNSVAGYTNGEVAVMVVEPTSTTAKQAFTGTIDTAGVQLTSVVWTAGTNQTHAGGATVVDYATATHIDMITKGLLRDHNQSGYHKTLNDDNGNEWLKQTSVASAVNEVTLANAATGTSPSLTATGGDTNVDIKLMGKGTGKAYSDSITEWGNDFVVSGLVWTADSAGVNRAGSMTAGFAYISGVRVTVAVVTAHTFTASKDTYIDLSSSGTITYTEATNNAVSPALSANNIRIGIVVTAAGSIAAAASINQGQEDRILPIASSIAYSVTDSLGNLICPRDPQRKLLGLRQIVGNFAPGATAETLITGLNCPVIVPTGRKVKATLYSFAVTGTTGVATLSIYEGLFGSGGTKVQTSNSTSSNGFISADRTYTSAAGSLTFTGTVASTASNPTVNAASTNPSFLRIELV